MSIPQKHPRGISLTICFFLVLTVLLNAQTAPNKRPLTHDVYDSWRSINSPKISVDGQWVLYLDTPQKGDADLVVLNTKSRREYRHTIGFSGEGTDAEKEARATFSYDSKHVIFLISPAEAEVKEEKKEKKKKKEGGKSQGRQDRNNNDDKLKKKLGILSLSDGKVLVVDEVKSFKLPEEAGGWVAYLKEEKKKDKEKKEEAEEKAEEKEKEQKEEKDKDKEKKYGTQLILRSLKDGNEKALDSVLDYLFTKDGDTFFYTISSKESPEMDGVYALQPGGESLPLLTGQGNYPKWALNKNETHLAFLTDREDFDAEKPTFNLYGLKIGDNTAALWVSHTSTAGFPQGMAVSDKSDLSFTEDGRIVMFGIKEIPEPEKEDEDEEEKAKFDLWHWNDPYPQPQQKLMADRVRNNTWESVYHVDTRKFVKLADKEIPDVELAWNGKVAFAASIWPYTKRVSYFGSYYDVYVIDPTSGAKTLVKKKLYGRASLSPQAKHITWFEGTDWFAYNIATKATVNLTESLEVRFEREDWDTPSPPRGYGIAGWTENDAAVLIYDRYDIWEIKPDGSSARMITEGFGRKQDLSFRYMRLDPEEKNIDPGRTLILRSTNEETMARGFYTDRVQGSAQPHRLLMADNSFSQVVKAKNTDRVFFTRTT
ncbi:MAG: hypothetical protein GQ544_07730, partial [Candidatus Aminicenantes bacterium]|nr:hypothetical protein [Candidatus Aminicenantes bacterium]